MHRRLTVFLLASCLVWSTEVLAGDGCTADYELGCGGCACEACVCAMDSICCEVGWDSICVSECTDECGGCGGSSGGGETPLGIECGAIGYQGCCVGTIVVFCPEGGTELHGIDCAEAPSCGWNATEGYYDCGTAGQGEPSGSFPIGCCADSSLDGCCNGNTLVYCELGETKQMDCSGEPSCGWNSEKSYYDCGTSGGSDPSGMIPKNCSGGPVNNCGNGICESGETIGSCPADCQSGCTPQCSGKQCGPDGCSGLCGTCQNGDYCNIEGQCVGEICTPDCTGKECGTDGCSGSCGVCNYGFVCSALGKCTSGECIAACAGLECGPDGCGGVCGECDTGEVCADGLCLVEEPGSDAGCVPECFNRVCGTDGCGGTCGECPQNYDCNHLGLCVPDENNNGTPYACPTGKTLIYGKCVDAVVKDNNPKGDPGCSSSTRSSTSGFALLVAAAVLLALARRLRTT